MHRQCRSMFEELLKFQHNPVSVCDTLHYCSRSSFLATPISLSPSLSLSSPFPGLMCTLATAALALLHPDVSRPLFVDLSVFPSSRTGLVALDRGL